MAARTETRRNALLTVAAVLVGVVALNTVIDVLARSARIDLTQDRLYSTSKGVDRTLGTLDEPVRIDFFWTQEGSKDQPLIRAHAQRVREYLRRSAAVRTGTSRCASSTPSRSARRRTRRARRGCRRWPWTAAVAR